MKVCFGEKRAGSLVFLALLTAGSAWCQEDLTLDEAVALAIRGNRQIRAAHLEVAKSEDAVTVARTYRLPSFRFNLLELQPLRPISFNFPTGSLGTFAATGPIPAVDTSIKSPYRPATLALASADQPLTQLRRIRIGIKLQDLNRQLALQRLHAQEQEVAFNVRKAYFNLLQTQSALDATVEALKLFREVERVAKESLAQQAVLQGDVLEVQTRVAQAELDELTLRNGLLTVQGQINALVGRPLETSFRAVAIAEPVKQADMDAGAALARALLQRPELAEARLKVQQAEQDRELKKAEALPDLSLTVDYLGLGAVRFLPSNTAVVGLAMNWNVFDWGRRKAELASKEKTVEQARVAVSETEAQIQLQVDAERRKLEEGGARLKVSDLSRKTAAEKLRVVLNKQQEQASLVKDVLQMQAALAEANHRYQTDLLAFWTAGAEFQRALGER